MLEPLFVHVDELLPPKAYKSFIDFDVSLLALVLLHGHNLLDSSISIEPFYNFVELTLFELRQSEHIFNVELQKLA